MGHLKSDYVKLIGCLILSIFYFYLYYSIPETFSSKQAEMVKDLNGTGFYFKECKCHKHVGRSRNSQFNVTSDCSEEATFYGPGQKVISFSYYINTSVGFSNLIFNSYSVYFNGIEPNLEKLRIFYPGWVMRVYTNENVDKNEKYCSVICNNDDFFWCDIRKIAIPSQVNDSAKSEFFKLNDVFGMIWRFIPLGDKTVDLFISRDLDGLLSKRESEAVIEWQNSMYPFHGMRDSIWHRVKILIGLCGMKNSLFGWSNAITLRNTILTTGNLNLRTVDSFDQLVIRKYVYYEYPKLFLFHASYFCNKFEENESRPFPSQRISYEFVGQDWRKYWPLLTYINSWISFTPCPEECRPSWGKDWLYC